MARREFVAYRVTPVIDLPIVTAPAKREWMDRTVAGFANRCLPMLLANQAGWFILNDGKFKATWDGGINVEAIKIEGQCSALSHFGFGILTWHIPYLFRTPKGYNLLARGPPNMPKDGICALEGLVETDWAVATFTMNWMFTRPGTVTFEAGEPICMIIPQKRKELETFIPLLKEIDSSPELKEKYLAWAASRAKFNAELNTPNSDAVREKWQKDYFQGKTTGPAERRVAEIDHQTKLTLREFKKN